MLSELLQELQPQLIRRAQALGARNLSKLVDELIVALDHGHANLVPCKGHVGVSSDLDTLVKDVHILSDCIHDIIEERELAVPAREFRVFTGWINMLTEAAWRERSRRFSAMLDALPDHVVLTDMNGDLVYGNKAAHEFPREVLEQPEARAQIDRDLARARAGETLTSEVRLGARWVEHTLSPVFTSDGEIEAIAVAARDISARKTAAAHMELVMGILGHDLRNPLAAVSGLSGLLLLQELPDKARDGVQQIAQSARRMSEMVETLLDVTRSRVHGTLPINRSESDLAQVTLAVVDELRAAHAEREIRFETIGELIGTWDAARMAEVVSNLVANALTHGDPNTPVEVALEADGAEVQLRVSNRGPVVSDSLFEPFRRGRTGNGLGLGLYIAREIVRAHGGTINVESSSERTTFIVKLQRSTPMTWAEVPSTT